MPTTQALIRAPLRPEARLLFLTAWREGPPADASIRELVPQIRNWPWFIAVAELERATRVVWQRLSALGVLPPGEDGLQLEQMATIAAFRAEHLRARLQETLDILAREGIEVIILKGAALATTIYPSFIERPMGDLDLLVDPNDAERAHAAARTAGWKWDQASFPRARYDLHHHLPPLDDAAGTGVRLELHRAIAINGHPFALSFPELRQRSRAVRVEGAPARVPCSEHLLLHEAVHFAWSHILGFGAWRTVRDVQQMCSPGLIDWDVFAKEAELHRAGTCAYWTLGLAKLLAGADVPDPVLERNRPRIGSLAQRVLERHFIFHLLPTEAEWPSQRLRRSLWEKAIQPDMYGHGTTRPWQFDERGPEPVLAATKQSESRRIASRLARLGFWARYVRALA